MSHHDAPAPTPHSRTLSHTTSDAEHSSSPRIEIDRTHLSRERIPVSVHATSHAASVAIATEIAGLLRSRAAEGRTAVLGLATGSTPQGVYEELVRMHQEEGLSFANAVTFNLDEYWPMQPNELQSYRRFMQEHLFNHIDIKPENIHVPDGTSVQEDVATRCADYERAIRDAGGVDLQLLGIGRTGHVGFNEPGSPKESRTRLITLDRVTRMDASSDFFGERNVPRRAITMGVGSILDARKVLLLAFGEHKAEIVKCAVEGPISPAVAASFLQEHRDARFVLDPAAAARLTRFHTPWLLGEIEQFGLQWDEQTTLRAVIWLAETVKKPILKLVDEDYNEHGLQPLLATRGSAYDINIEVFRSLQATITGWPGGKPEDTDSPFPKRVLVFSPHPDDDVISMGGTFIRLCDQGHQVHVAYQTSGNIAVWDDCALRHMDFVREFAGAFPQLGREFTELLEANIEQFIASKKSGTVDSLQLQKVKTLIRRSEARAGARWSGVRPECIHFLDLPFYETGRIRKKPIGSEDLRITCELLRMVQPQQIYAAGDLSDPHGTHRTCLAVIIQALELLRKEPKELDWLASCVVWLYRGAWQEWSPGEIQMAVPLSPDEVIRKRFAIFKHESQKDTPVFPGASDPREFWQRAEDRNRATADAYDRLGLAEYEAMEGFVKLQATQV